MARKNSKTQMFGGFDDETRANWGRRDGAMVRVNGWRHGMTEGLTLEAFVAGHFDQVYAIAYREGFEGASAA